MNSSQMTFLAEGGAASQCERVLTLLKHHLNEWVGMPHLVEYSGSYVIHSRISDLRRQGHSIINRTEKDPATGNRLSYYKLLP